MAAGNKGAPVDRESQLDQCCSADRNACDHDDAPGASLRSSFASAYAEIAAPRGACIGRMCRPADCAIQLWVGIPRGIPGCSTAQRAFVKRLDATRQLFLIG
jgi:hypothetical protein